MEKKRIGVRLDKRTNVIEFAFTEIVTDGMMLQFEESFHNAVKFLKGKQFYVRCEMHIVLAGRPRMILKRIQKFALENNLKRSVTIVPSVFQKPMEDTAIESGIHHIERYFSLKDEKLDDKVNNWLFNGKV